MGSFPSLHSLHIGVADFLRRAVAADWAARRLTLTMAGEPPLALIMDLREGARLTTPSSAPPEAPAVVWPSLAALRQDPEIWRTSPTATPNS